MPLDRSYIRVKAMLVAPDATGTSHAVTLNGPTRENPGGFPMPAAEGATLTESDGSVVPVVWRPVLDEDEPLPPYPAAVRPWVTAAVRD